ncbi:YdbL family protein [Hyphomonas sp.]|uniref:YdbL family protein n=1 Tax=Hyphomonas sp. TaxID=87 RepID=UPI003918A623
MTFLRTLFLSLILVLGAVAAAQGQGRGDPQIEAARASGVIGERIDGYLGIVTSADAEITRKVQDINNRRRALYEQTARETGGTVQQVARVAGERQLADRVQSGEFFMDESGTWQRKP